MCRPEAEIVASSLLEELSITTDVLIVGGGMAGAWAATSAAQAGAKVVLVDKGYCGTSGVTAAAGPGHWWVPPDPPAARDAAVANRIASGLGLGEAEWMHRILDQTWRTLPTLASTKPHLAPPAPEAGGAIASRGRASARPFLLQRVYPR